MDRLVSLIGYLTKTSLLAVFLLLTAGLVYGFEQDRINLETILLANSTTYSYQAEGVSNR